jgi:hypothetical protein
MITFISKADLKRHRKANMEIMGFLVYKLIQLLKHIVYDIAQITDNFNSVYART